MSNEKNKGYRDTLNLPKTSFSMKANLTQREPQLRKEWAKKNIYAQIREARKDAPLYILHDGPPYANGDIHMGHVINKVLKDFVVKYKTMTGFDAPFVPGWDCHGLPIELKVVTELGDKVNQMSKPDIRKLCYKYASKYVKLQSKQFQSLGIFGDFENPYLTFKPGYEAGILEVFAELVDKGLVYKQLKPIHWSLGCQTALAEAELEYKDISSPSIFVNFPLAEESAARLVECGLLADSEAENAKVCFMIWTTTPWTLAANLAVAVNPALDYKAIYYEKNGEKFISIVADERLEAVIEAGRIQNLKVGERSVKGSELEGLRYVHPFVENNPTDKDAYIVIGADYVTTEDGTGLVHTAPGHGLEDYISGQKYGLAIYSPVMDDGCYDDTVPKWLVGKNVLKVDSEVNENLEKAGLLFAKGEITHSYPHCWRSKMPVIFRATEQWFISIDKELPGVGKNLRDLSLESIKNVKWIPAWGQKRIEGMLESRPDWCISRQRSWGLPLPVFLNSSGQTLLTKESVLAVAKHIARKGADSWFTDSPLEILGESFELPAGFDFDDLQKEENIFDVWFESGCSWYSVCERGARWPVPVDLYLEGSDQHRGWFQSSLLLSLAANGAPPFKTVLTHGFMVDADREKISKSRQDQGGYEKPQTAETYVGQWGADILRLWVASQDYRGDIVVSVSSEPAVRARRGVMELLLARAPENAHLQALARRMGVEGTSLPTVSVAQRDCVLCGLCTAVCEEVIGRAAIGFAGRGAERVVASPFHQPAEDCIACGACAAICPVGTITIRFHEDTDEIEISPFKTRAKIQRCTECGARVLSLPVTEEVLRRVNIDWDKYRRQVRLCARCRRRSAVGAISAGGDDRDGGPGRGGTDRVRHSDSDEK